MLQYIVCNKVSSAEVSSQKFERYHTSFLGQLLGNS